MTEKVAAVRSKKFATLVAAVFLTLFGLSYGFQEELWALHDVWFLNPVYQCVILTVVCLSILSIWVRYPNWMGRLRPAGNIWLLIMLALVVAASLVYAQFPIHFDDYGNAFEYRNFKAVIAAEPPPNFVSEMLSFNFEPSLGRKTLLNVYAYLSHQCQMTYGQIFKWSGLVCGFVFGVSMLLIILRSVKDNTLRIVSLAFCITAPLTMVFHHHFEIYAPIYASISVWFLLFVQFARSKKWMWFFLLSALTLVCCKLHPLSSVLLVGLVLVGISRSDRVNRFLNWKNLFYFIHLPLIVLGLFIYFFVTEDYNDPRFLDGVTDAERLFLPLISPPAPLDRYNMFSFNHILDYLNAVLLWSIPALFILVFALISAPKSVDWNNKQVLIPLNMAFMTGGILFAINPLLSMPMDRDLFMFPSIFVLFGAFGILGQFQINQYSKFLVPVVCMFTVLQLPRILVDSKPELLSQKFEVTGRHVFKTYHLHSSRILINSLNLKGNIDDYLNGKSRILEDLKPYATLGNDPKYANLLMDDGFYFLRFGNDPQMAVVKLEEALKYHPQSKEIRVLLNEASQRLQTR